MGDPLLIDGQHETYNIEIYARGLDKAAGSSQIPLAPPATWGSQVQFQFALLQFSESGRLLLEAIRRDGRGRWVRILPHFFFKNTSGNAYDHYCQADTHGVNSPSGGRNYAVEVQYSANRFFKGSYC